LAALLRCRADADSSAPAVLASSLDDTPRPPAGDVPRSSVGDVPDSSADDVPGSPVDAVSDSSLDDLSDLPVDDAPALSAVDVLGSSSGVIPDLLLDRDPAEVVAVSVGLVSEGDEGARVVAGSGVFEVVSGAGFEGSGAGLGAGSEAAADLRRRRRQKPLPLASDCALDWAIRFASSWAG